MVNICYYYAQEDKDWWDRLAKHLETLEREQYIESWHPGKIKAGESKDTELQKHIQIADILVLLISSAFMCDCFYDNPQIERALERNNLKEITIVPIILRPSSLQDTPLESLWVLPENGKAVSLWQDHDEAFSAVADNIRHLVKKTVAKVVPARLAISDDFGEEEERQLLLVLQLCAVSNPQESTNVQIIAIHKKLKERLIQRIDPATATLLARFELEPDVWRRALAEKLKPARLTQDRQIMAYISTLVKLLAL